MVMQDGVSHGKARGFCGQSGTSVESLRRELKTVLDILEHRRGWLPLAPPSALCAHARQLTHALQSLAGAGQVGRHEAIEWQKRLREAQTNMHDQRSR